MRTPGYQTHKELSLTHPLVGWESLNLIFVILFSGWFLITRKHEYALNQLKDCKFYLELVI